MERRQLALERLRDAGSILYGEETVTQLEHAQQCAALAASAGASPAMVVAALLHDIGHVLQPGDAEAARRGRDLHHEDIGASFLEWCGFPEAVVQPVRLHVQAKRLLARDASYRDALSPIAVASLALQGGIMTDEEADAFVDQPYATEAVDLRRWDDAAKLADWDGPDLDHWVDLVASV